MTRRPQIVFERLVATFGRTPGRSVKLVVVVDADDPLCLRPNEDIERDAGRLEPIDHPDPMRVARRVAISLIGLDDAAGCQFLDAFDRVADQVCQLVPGQAPG